VQTPARYIGMIGSRRKAISIFRNLTAEGLKPELFERVHSPVGLDIGAISPEEVAVSIVAELIGVRRRAERALPHMSWFHKNKLGNAEALDSAEEAEEGCSACPSSGETE